MHRRADGFLGPSQFAGCCSIFPAPKFQGLCCGGIDGFPASEICLRLKEARQYPERN